MTPTLPDEHGNLPAVPGGAGVAEVVDGEVVEAPEPPRPAYTVTVLGVARTARAAAVHPGTRAVARHAGYVAAGLVVAARRRRRARTLAGEMALLAAARGDHDKAKDWAELDHKHRQERRHGLREGFETAAKLLVLLPKIIAGALVVLAAASFFMLLAGGVHGMEEPWKLSASVVAAGLGAAVDAWDARRWLASAAAAGTLAWLHYVGRTAGALAPKWAQTSAAGDDIAIDERAVTQAIANLRFPEVRDYLKAGHPMQFITPCRTDGRGTYFEVRLPGGLTAERVAKRRASLAASLYRLPKETWPSVGSDASILKGWIADKGALEEGAGPYPLLEEGFADVFKGLPFGRTLRGDPARQPVIGRNSIDGGMPEQGKSNGARVIAAGYALDLVTELRIYVPDTNFDFEAFEPRCSRYLMGAEDEVIERMLEEQELLKEELQRRGQLLVDHGVQEVTYDIAHAGVGLHPVFCLVEEAHVPIQHKKYGKDFAQLLGENVKLDRKRAVHIKVSTQAPVRGAMPRDVTTNCTVGVAYALADIYANDAILGPGAYSAGHRATELIPGTDAGTALCKGFAGEARSEMIQAYRLNTGQVPQVVARAMKELARRGKPVPGTERGPAAITQRDLLDDLDQVIDGPDRVRLAELPARLRKLAPSWSGYRSLSGTQLRAQLTDLKVRTTKSENVPYLDPSDLRRTVVARKTEEW